MAFVRVLAISCIPVGVLGDWTAWECNPASVSSDLSCLLGAGCLLAERLQVLPEWHLKQGCREDTVTRAQGDRDDGGFN